MFMLFDNRSFEGIRKETVFALKKGACTFVYLRLIYTPIIYQM